MNPILVPVFIILGVLSLFGLLYLSTKVPAFSYNKPTTRKAYFQSLSIQATITSVVLYPIIVAWTGIPGFAFWSLEQFSVPIQHLLAFTWTIISFHLAWFIVDCLKGTNKRVLSRA